ncbi:MAG: hypothetical protein J3K34DRAFT_501652 [Monoraphidium minutum]|nr:MAG: hypothetical protein J3K34DRAFT_501652 [Monoraphidium minutum]
MRVVAYQGRPPAFAPQAHSALACSAAARPRWRTNRMDAPAAARPRAAHAVPDAGTAAVPDAGATAALWWVRGDMRLADNEVLAAATGARYLLPIFCLDPSDLAPRRPVAAGGAGVPLLGPHRCRLLLEAAHSLRSDLSALGSGLAWRAAPPAAALPAALRAAAPGLLQRGVSRVSLLLHHAPDATARALALEDAAAAAFEAEARALGLAPAVVGLWGATLHHPDDLRFAAAPGGGGGEAAGGGGRAAPPNADPRRYGALPRVMTEFRRAAQAHSAARAPLPRPAALPPLPPLSGDGGGGGGPGGAAAAAGAALELSNALSAPLPTDVLPLYEAAGPEALGALRRLAALTAAPGLAAPGGAAPRYAGGAPPGGSAFPFEGGEAAAAARLRGFLRGSQGLEGPGAAADGGGASGGGGAAAPLEGYGEARMMAGGVDASTKLSPFLALGCISPRQVEAEVRALQQQQQEQQQQQQQQQQLEQQRQQRQQQPVAPAPEAQGMAAQPPGSPRQARPAKRGGKAKKGGGGGAVEGCEWLVMHLGIRDFFVFTALKAGDALVTTGTAAAAEGGGGGGAAGGGRGGKEVAAAAGEGGGSGGEWRVDEEAFGRWAAGRTGFPFVDACMRELARTGWMSNRGRQNAASFLAKELGLDWRLGAELFESLLVDSEPAANWGNWAYCSGTGNDPRNRKFKTVTQGERYDPEAQLAATWLPELRALAPARRHRPWEATAEEAAAAGVVLGETYPAPMLP